MFEELQRKEKGERRKDRERAKVVAAQSKGGATEIDASQKTSFSGRYMGANFMA